MKGIVFQIEGREAVIMKNGGEFVTVTANPEWQVGDLVTIQQARFNLKVFYTLAACIVLVISLGVGVYHLYFAQAALISMDINPSIEFGLNRLDRVISVTTHNPEAESILQNTDIEGRTYTDAVKLLISNEELSRYISDNSYVLFTVQTSDKAKQDTLLANLQSTADAAVLPHHLNVSTEYYAVDSQTVHEAHQYGMTAGKYMVVLELQQLAPEIDISEYSHCTVEEIKGQIQSHAENHSEGQGHDAAENSTENENSNRNGSSGSNENSNGNEHDLENTNDYQPENESNFEHVAENENDSGNVKEHGGGNQIGNEEQHENEDEYESESGNVNGSENANHRENDKKNERGNENGHGTGHH